MYNITVFVFLNNLNCSIIFQGTYTDGISIAKEVDRHLYALSR